MVVAAGCATPAPDREIRVAVHELAEPELVDVCNKGAVDRDPGLLGCFEWKLDVCHVYMLPRWARETHDGNLEGYHSTLGHEVDHCAKGLFHGQDKGVPLLRLPNLTGR